MAVVMMLSGAKDLWDDYRDSWTSLDGAAAKQARRKAAAYYFLTPTVASAPFWIWRIELPIVTPLLTSMSVFTALLFGLLFLVFNLAVTLRKDGDAIASAHDLPGLIEDMRAAITYTIVVAVLLVGILALATILLATTTPGPLSGQGWLWTPAIVWLGAHLALNLFKVLARFRTAFSYVSR